MKARDLGNGVWDARVTESLPEGVDIAKKRQLRISGLRTDTRIALQILEEDGQIVNGMWIMPSDLLDLAQEAMRQKGEGTI